MRFLPPLIGILFLTWTTVAFHQPYNHHHDCLAQTPHRVSSSLYSSNTDSPTPSPKEGIRLNKVLKATHSRRQTDAIIQEGRIAVNKEIVFEPGIRVIPFVDIIQFDGVTVDDWEELNGYQSSSTDGPKQVFDYIKYWKPKGIICTTDRTIQHNILSHLEYYNDFQTKTGNRVYPVGRLDKDTSGLMLLTSDGRLPNSALRGKYKRYKTYSVQVDRRIREMDAEKWRKGVVITTIAQRDRGVRMELTTPTKPALVDVLDDYSFEISIVEGRNRQIRKMCAALGYDVVALHRSSFMGITLDGLDGAGDWKELDGAEMGIVEEVLESAEGEADAQ